MATSFISSSVLQQSVKAKLRVFTVFKISRIVLQLQTLRHMPFNALAMMWLRLPSKMHHQQVCMMDQSLLALLIKAKPQLKFPIVPTQVRKLDELLL
jgi:hypothetical protein